jgi:hypothetical protein
MNQNEAHAKPVEYNTTLNPKLWDNDRLKGEVKGALMNIAEDFREFIGIDFDVVDVVITGGNVNYNYTSKSDIDLHLIADFSTVACDREVAELFDTKRLLYKRDHDIQINGIPVELYVEDQDHPAVSAGTFSIMNDQWLRKPNKNLPRYDQQVLEHWVDVWHTLIKRAMHTGDLQQCRKVLNLLRKYRKMGLGTKEGEFSIPNLVYKSLRNDDTLKGITILIDRLHDQELSI